MSDKYKENKRHPKNETKIYYLVTDKPNGVTVYDPNWSESIGSLTADKPYLWSYSHSIIEGFHSTTEPRIISYYSVVSGDDIKMDSKLLAEKLRLTKDIETVRTNSPKGSLGVDSMKIEHVNHPNHYNDNEIETFEMFLLFYHNQPEKIQGALIFNIFKYRDRLGKKASPEDEGKMKWYLDKFELLFPDEYELYNIYHSSKKNS